MKVFAASTAGKHVNPAMRRLTSFTLFVAYLGLAVLVAGYFLTRQSVQFHTQAYLSFFVPALLLLILKRQAIRQMLTRNRALQWYTMLLLWFGVSLVWTPFDDKPYILRLLFMLWLLAVVVRLLMGDLRCFTIAISASVFVLAVTAAWTVLQHIQVTGAGFYAQRLDYFGPRQLNPVLVGLVAANLIIYCLSCARLLRAHWVRVAFLLMAGVFLALLLLSFSRTALIGLLLTAVWYLFVLGRGRVAVALSLATVMLLGLMLADTSQQWLVSVSRSLSVEIRLWGWQQTLELIREHWLLGLGVRAPFSVSWEGTPLEALNPDLYQPHNLFLAIWYETGIVGLLLLLAMFGAVVKKLRGLWFAREIRYFSCVCFFILLTCLVDRPVLIDRPSAAWVWFWLPLAVALSADKLVARPPVAA